MRQFHRLGFSVATAAAIVIGAGQLVQAQQAKPAVAGPAAGATLLGQYGDWGAYTASPGGRKICFALSKPTSGETNPPNRRNESMSVYMFVSSRPAEKVKDEVSVLISGYAFKPGADATAQIGNGAFPMYTQKDGAWIKNAAEEARMVESMRKASDLTLKAVTDKGTETVDRFSLKGVDQALTRVATECK